MSDLFEFCKVEEYIFCNTVITRIQEFYEKEIKKKDFLLKKNIRTRESVLLFEKCLARGRFLIHKCAELVDSVKSISVGREPDRRVAVYVFNYKINLIFDQTRKRSMTSRDTRIEKKRPDKEIFIPRYRRTCDDLATNVSSTPSEISVISKQDTVKEHKINKKNDKKREKGVPKNNENNISVDDLTNLSKPYNTSHLKKDRVSDKIDNISYECNNTDNKLNDSYLLKRQLENELATSLKIDSSLAKNNDTLQTLQPEMTIPSVLYSQNGPLLEDNSNFENCDVDNSSTIHVDTQTLETIQELLLNILNRIEILMVPHFDVVMPVCCEIFRDQIISSQDYKTDFHLEILNSIDNLTDRVDAENASSCVSVKCCRTFVDQIINDNSVELVFDASQNNASQIDASQKDDSQENDSLKDGSQIDDSLKSNSPKDYLEDESQVGTPKDDLKEDNSKSLSKKSKKEKRLKRNKKNKKICSSIVEKEDHHHIEVTETMVEQVNDCGNDWHMNWTDDGDCLNKAVLEFSSLTGIKDPIVEEAQIIDYLSFSTKDITLDEGEFGHIVELFDFSPVLKSQDIFNALKTAGVSDYNITWVDDTHALAVFSSQKAAHEAVKSYSPMLQMRQVINGTRQSKIKAREFKDVLLPYKKRPPTTGAVARNLISGALGIKANLTHEQKIKDRNVLKEAREQKRIKAKQIQDVWDGNQ